MTPAARQTGSFPRGKNLPKGGGTRIQLREDVEENITEPERITAHDMKGSVVMAVYNERAFIEEVLRRVQASAFFLTPLPGSTGGDVVKDFYATQGNQGWRTEVGTIILLDRAVDMFAPLICPLLIAPLFPQLVSSTPILRDLLRSAAVLASAMLAGLLVCFSSRVRNSQLLSGDIPEAAGGNLRPDNV